MTYDESRLPRNWFQRVFDDIRALARANFVALIDKIRGSRLYDAAEDEVDAVKNGAPGLFGGLHMPSVRLPHLGVFNKLRFLKRLLPQKRRTFAIAAVAAIFAAFNGWVVWENGFVPTEAPQVAKQDQPGATIAFALRNSIQTELDHGWIPNDMFWPTVLCWNYSDFQLGELEVWRRTAFALREHLARVRKTDTIDENLDAATTALYNKAHQWMLPSYESKMEEAVTALDKYVGALPQKHDFSERADNLAELIISLASTMGATQNYLAQALPSQLPVPDTQSPASQTALKDVDTTNVGFWGSSKIFYTAKGQAYATLIVMEAVRLEYADVLKKKNADVLVNDAIFWLREAIALRPIVVLHSGRDSIFANHLDNFAAPFGQARAKINSLIDVLRNG